MTKKDFDNLFTITDKFLKRILFILGRVIYNIDKWIDILFVALIQYEWGISQITINDRDSKFISKLWQIIFKKLEIAIFTFIAYYFQINEQSERIN